MAVLAVVRGELHAAHGADLAHVLLASPPRAAVDVLLGVELGQEGVAPGRTDSYEIVCNFLCKITTVGTD